MNGLRFVEPNASRNLDMVTMPIKIQHRLTADVALFYCIHDSYNSGDVHEEPDGSGMNYTGLDRLRSAAFHFRVLETSLDQLLEYSSFFYDLLVQFGPV